MDQHTRNQEILRKYIPEKAVPLMAEWVIFFDFKLKIRRPRQTFAGDYRPPRGSQTHLITINRDLNPYSFLITLVHEVAHLLTYLRHAHRVKPHGEEWKQAYRELMRPVVKLDVFPEDVRLAVIAYMKDPAASSCSDDTLHRVLKKYDPDNGMTHLEELPERALFNYNGRIFVKGPVLRKRFQCKERATGNSYLFSPMAEVRPIQES